MSTTINAPSYKEDLKELVSQLTDMLPEDKFAVFNKDAEKLAQIHQSPLAINVKDLAPDFSLPNAKGQAVHLADVLSNGPVVLTFYRGIWCPYCNLHLKLLQQILPEIKNSGANLLAISPMKPDHSASMSESNRLEFEVLSDFENQVAKQYTTVFKNADDPINTMSELGYDFYSFYDEPSAELPISATFVIASDGEVIFAESEGGDYRLRTEPRKILNILETIK